MTQEGTDHTVCAFLISGFSLLNMSEFFVIRKTETYETDNHPLCGCATIVIQKNHLSVIIEVSSHY